MSDQRPSVHFVGIGGVGMRGLAEMSFQRGWRVSGSDQERSAYLTRLEAKGITIHIGHRSANLADDVDLVIASAAIKTMNVELEAARRRHVPVKTYAEALGDETAARHTTAVSGCHGKTTTTAMIAWVLDQAGMNPSFVVGANVPQLGAGSRAGGDLLVVEACEFNRSFHNLHPEIAVVTNVEEDHLDTYKGGLPEIIDSFAHFVGLVPAHGLVVACAENAAAMEAVLRLNCSLDTYALDAKEPWTWTGSTTGRDAGCYSFTVRRYGERFGRIRLAIPGRHNALNALAATAVLAHLEVPADAIESALAEFHGAERRSQFKGEVNGVSVVDDYAHHPTEIKATLRALKDRYRPRRLWCVFQPHQHSRTRCLLKDFAASFVDADCVIVPEIYFARDSEEERARVNSQTLVERIRETGKTAEHVAELERIPDRLIQDLRPGDLLVTLGAGSVWKVADEVLRRLQLRRAG